MKKKLSLLMVALLSVMAFAATVTWKVTAETAVAAESSIYSDDALTVKTVFATQLTAENITINEQEFTHYINVRVDKFPTAEIPTGTKKNDTSSPLVFEPKKDMTVSVYYLRQPDGGKGLTFTAGNGKDLRFYDQAVPTVAISGTTVNISKINLAKKEGTEEDDPENASNAYVWQTFSLEANKTYTLCASGTTIRFYGVTYETAEEQGGGETGGEEKTDVLTSVGLGATANGGTSYADFTGKTFSSDAVYSVNMSAGNVDAIQLRSKNSTSGIVSTTSGGKVKSVSLTWGESTVAGRTIQVYGSNTAYTAPTDLYGDNQGTLLGELNVDNKTTSTTITVEGDYEYVGIRSKSEAMYLTNVTIVWEAKAAPVSPYPAEAIWGGELGDWTEAAPIEAAKLEGLGAGDELVVNFIKIADVAGQWDAMLIAKCGDFEVFKAGIGNQTASAETPYVEKAVISGLMKNEILSKGLTISGKNCEAYITINKAQTPAADNSLWIGQAETVGEWGGYAMPAAPYVVGKVIKINASTPTVSASARSNRALPEENSVVIKKNVDGWPDFTPDAITATPTAAGDGYEFTVTEAIVEEITAHGFVVVSLKPIAITAASMTEYFAINIADGIQNGTVKANVEKAEAGAEVTLTATPAEGYKLAKFIVKKGDEEIAVSNGKFTMPEGEVVVSAIFAQPEDIEINAAAGSLTDAIKAATEDAGKVAKNITINLTAGAQYTISSAISAGYNLTINGNGATIDASGADVNFIELKGSVEKAIKADEATVSDHYLINTVSVTGVTVKGLKKAIIRDTQKTLLKVLTIDNCVMEASNAKPAIDFDGKGYIEQLNVKNSTIWAAASTNKNFTKYGSRPKNLWTKDGDDTDVPGIYTLQGYDVQNSTFVNIASAGQHFCNNSQKGTAQNVYVIKNNIFVDCGKIPNQVIVGFNGGQASGTPTWDVDGNIFNATVESVMTEVSAQEVAKAGKKEEVDIVKNSVAGLVAFKDAANGDFNGVITMNEGAVMPASMPGDPRWTITEPITVEKLYIMGNGTPGGWDATTEMTFNEETQAFEFTLEVSADGAWFTFGDAPFTGWDDFNANHRFAIGAGDVDATIGETLTLVQVNGTLAIKTAGKYLISVTKDLKMTITAKTDGISEVKANQNNAVIYNLNGVRVDKAQKGLYIVNGKKVVIK